MREKLRPLPRAFTLIELLVILAIVLVLAGLLLPVFASAKAMSARSVCASNFHGVSVATSLYLSDYDDLYMPVSHQPMGALNSRNDRTWVQLVLPYVRSFNVFHCPADPSPGTTAEATFDQDLIPGDLFSQYYTASLQVNMGYNYLYLSPVTRMGDRWAASPRSATQIDQPSRTITFVDSIWGGTGGSRGGGSWVVMPPCRYADRGGSRVDTFAPSLQASGDADDVLTLQAVDGWQPSVENSPLIYGGAWPRHQGRMTVAFADGSVRNETPLSLSDGCEIQSQWQGLILDSSRYPWDLN